MRILALDIGTGTQDILLFDTELQPENCFKMVMPSPTMTVARKVKAATKRGQPILLYGVTMGGGPCHWAVTDHIEAGYTVYATPPAAHTFDDDLDKVGGEMGIKVISEDEAADLDIGELPFLANFPQPPQGGAAFWAGPYFGQQFWRF